MALTTFTMRLSDDSARERILALPDKSRLFQRMCAAILCAKPHLLEGVKADVRTALNKLALFAGDADALYNRIDQIMELVEDAVPKSSLEQARDRLRNVMKAMIPNLSSVELTFDRVNDRFVPNLKITVRDSHGFDSSSLRDSFTFEGFDCSDEGVSIVTNDGNVQGRCFNLVFSNIYKRDPTETWGSDGEVFGVTDPSVGIRNVRHGVDATMN